MVNFLFDSTTGYKPLSAHEANKQTNDFLEKEKQIKSDQKSIKEFWRVVLEPLIKDAIKRGKFSVTIDLYDYNRREVSLPSNKNLMFLTLEKLGYKVTQSARSDALGDKISHMTVSWAMK